MSKNTAGSKAPVKKELHKYTSGDIEKILDGYFEKYSDVGCTEIAVLEDEEKAKESFAAAIESVALGKARAVAMPIHIYGSDTHPGHWTMAVVRKNGNGKIDILYNDSLYDPNDKNHRHKFVGHPNAKKIVASLRDIEKDLKLQPNTCNVIDLKHQQQKDGVDCGPFAVDNMVQIALSNDKVLDGLASGKVKAADVLYVPKDQHDNPDFSGVPIRATHIEKFPHLYLDDEIFEHVEKISEQHDLKGVYLPGAVDRIKNGLYRNIVEKGGLTDPRAKDFVSNVGKVFSRRSNLTKEYQIDSDKKKKLKEWEEKGMPASEAMQRLKETIVLGEDGKIHSPNQNALDNSTRIRDSLDKLEERIDERQSKISAADEELDAMLDKGRALTDEEEKNLRERHAPLSKIPRFIDEFKRAVKENVPGFGTTADKLKSSDRLKELQTLRNKLLAEAVWSLGPMTGDKNHFLSRLESLIESEFSNCPDAIFNMAMMGRVREIIAKETASMKEEEKKLLKSFDDNMQKIEEGLKKDEAKNIDSETSLMQARLLMMFVGVTPFGVFANVFGGILDYTNLLGSLTDSIFDPMPLSEKVSGALTSSKLDLFGIPVSTAMKEIKIPEAVNWLFNDSPVLSEIVAFQHDIFSSDIGQGVGNLFIKPVVGSSLLPLGVAALFGWNHIKTEIDHHQKVSKFMEDKEKSLKDAVKKYAESANKISSDKIPTIAKSIVDGMKSSYHGIELAKFITKANEKTLQVVFGDTKFTLADKSQATLAELKKSGKLDDYIDALVMAPENAQAREAALQSKLIYQEVDGKEKEFIAAKNDFEKKQKEFTEKKAKLAEEANKDPSKIESANKDIKKIDEDFGKLKKEKFGKAQTKVENACLDFLAQNHGINSSFTGDLRAKEIENILLQRYAGKIRSLHGNVPEVTPPKNNKHTDPFDTSPPSPKVTPDEVTKVTGEVIKKVGGHVFNGGRSGVGVRGH